jgi:hypothetical protein
MSTSSFRDAMTQLSELLYARAMEHRGEARRIHTPGKAGARANAQAHLSFEVKLEEGGVANVEVNKYCAGYTLSCAATIDSPYAGTVLAGHVHSSEGGGAVFGNFRAGKCLKFDLGTSFWSSTTFTLHLRTAPALPAGTVLKVRMDIDY